MKLKTKLISLVMIPIILILFGVGYVLFLFERKDLIYELEQRHMRILSAFGNVCQNAISVKDELPILNYLNVLKNENGFVSAVFADKNQNVVAHTNPLLIGTKFQHNNLKEIIFYEHSITDGKVGLSFSKKVIGEDINSRLITVGKRIIVIIGIAVFVGIIIAVFLSGLIVKPVKILANATEKISRGDFGQKIKVKTKDEIKELADAFNVMSQKLKELDRMKSDFVSSVTHELRSPLAAIESYVNLFIEGIDKSKQLEYLTIMKNNIQRLSHFIDNLLDISKIERKKVVLRKERTRIIDLIKEVADFFSPLVQEKNIVLKTVGDTGIPEIEIDTDKVRQVFTNLISNAIKFTPEGGRITVKAVNGKRETGDGKTKEPSTFYPLPSTVSSGFVLVSVSDTGIGIPSEDLNRIFDKFEQVGKSKGTGLGLAIVKSLVELHGGKIWVESEGLNKGSIFHFTLPV